MHIRGVIVLLSIVVGVILVGFASTPPPSTTSAASDGGTIQGTVVDEKGPVAGATVRVQATTNQTSTDADGRFTLAGLAEGAAVTVSAWKHGYYSTKVEGITPPASDIALRLHLYQTNDNPHYEWIPPVGEDSCARCKSAMVQDWLEKDAHANSARNPVFLTMYNGTDVGGRQSPPTRYGSARDYGRFPLRPDPSQPYYGPGYKLDFPDTAGNCAACHTPGAAVNSTYGIDPNTVAGADGFGIHCDFCHKIADVKLNRSTGMPFPNMPGVLSLDVRRPFLDDKERPQLFFGTFDDVNAAEGDTNLPLLGESRFCAPCHFGAFWDTVVYNSFGEWLDSPYSDPVKGKSCQECHTPAPMILNGVPTTNVAPDNGGVERDPATIHAHTFPGSRSEDLLRNSASMAVTAQREGDGLAVEVRITNDLTGHHVPTDSPLRNMILLVKATGPDGEALRQIGGPTVPKWGGVGDPADGYYAGLPGQGYAKVLEELWTEVSPTGAYWNHTRLLSDYRIAAFATDTSSYSFAAPSGEGEITVEATLIFRRAFVELAEQKGWDMPDVVMEREEVRESPQTHGLN